MIDNVYRVHSTLEVPHERLEAYLEDPTLPADIERLETERRGNQLFIEGVPAEASSVGKYTPTARLRATIADTRIYEYEGQRYRTEPATAEDESPPSTLVTFANFKGRLGTVLKNTALRGPMFVVLRDIAALADQGRLTAIVEIDGELQAVCVDAGEEIPASVEVVDEERQTETAESRDWHNARS
ncbi:MAG: hypothetical protein ABEH77_03070 [Halobacteriaceae archaeon]